MARTLAAIPESPKAGQHDAVLESVLDVKGRFDNPSLQWNFRTKDGCMIDTTTGADLKIGEACANLVGQLLGRQLQRDERIDIDSLVGKSYQITVVPRGMTVVLGSVEPVK